MIHADRFLDTSVIVRYLTGDPAELAVLAQRIVDGELALTVTDVVLTETVYILTSVYRIPREIVIDRVVSLVSKKNIVVFALDKDTVIHGLLMCRRSARVSISDAMIWAAARTAGATRIFTFDQRFPSEGSSFAKPIDVCIVEEADGRRITSSNACTFSTSRRSNPPFEVGGRKRASAVRSASTPGKPALFPRQHSGWTSRGQ